jgi:glycosyltransferase involved in cell wall biosynthesis
VWAQTRPPDEVIVVDDGSSDRTAEIAATFAGTRVVREANAGVSVARDRGAELASGDLLAFLDADDEWRPEKLALQVARLEQRPDVVASFAEPEYVDARTGARWQVRYRNAPDMVPVLLLEGCVIGNNSSVVVRREPFFAAGGYDPRSSVSADWDLWLRLAEQGPFDLVAAPLIVYRFHPGGMSRSVADLERDNVAILDRFFARPGRRARYRDLRRRAYANVYAVLAGGYLHVSDVRATVRCLALAAAYDPRSLARVLTFPVRAIRRVVRR